jgi:hypothetical protein
MIKNTPQNIYEEFKKFERQMEEICFIKSIAESLKTYRKMIKLKRYD